MVVRPDSETPFSALALAELAARAGIPGGRAQRRHRRLRRSIGPRADHQPGGAQAVLHRLDRRSGKILMEQSAEHGQEAGPGARRQRAVHRVRRRRHRRGGRRRGGVEVPQRRARPASAPTASTSTTACTTSSPRSWWRAVAELNGRRRRRPGRDRWARSSTPTRSRRSKSTSPTPSTKGARVLAGGARHALGGSFFEPTVLGRVTADARDRPRGDLRPAGPAVPLHGRGRTARRGQRHRVRPRRPTSTAATSAASGAWPRRSKSAWSASTSA